MNANRHKIHVTAEQDAQSDTNKLLWLVAGLVLNVIGLIIAYVYESSPPSTRLLEKSEEEILFYTEAYKAKTRQIQLTSALIGFIISVVLIIIFVVVLFSFLFSTYFEFMREVERHIQR